MTLALKAISLIGQNHAYNTSGTTRLFWGDMHMRTKSLVKVSLAFLDYCIGGISRRSGTRSPC